MQRPLLEIEHPVEFDPEIMEDTSGEDEMLLRGKEVGCVIFPAVLKIGDETGDNVSWYQLFAKALLTIHIQTHLKNVISKAKVLCVID